MHVLINLNDSLVKMKIINTQKSLRLYSINKLMNSNNQNSDQNSRGKKKKSLSRRERVHLITVVSDELNFISSFLVE